jgi:protein TonB
MGVVMLAHAAVIFGVPWQKPDDLAVLVTLQLDIVAGGEPAHATQQVDEKPSDAQVGEIKPVETPPAEVKTAADDVVPREAVEAKPAEQNSLSPSQTVDFSPQPLEAKPIAPAEQAPVDVDRQASVAVSAPVIRSEEPHLEAPVPAWKPPIEPAAEPARTPPSAPPREVQRQEKRNVRAENTRHATAAAPARVASRAGTESGRGETGSASSTAAAADYGRIVYAEIARRSHYPESASPATGTVVLSFTIGSSGRVTSSSIVQSSGNGLLDGAARQTMSALSLPPPPGGRYSNTVPIHLRPQ